MSGQVNAPVGVDAFSLLMEGFLPISSKIALAVSGGPDSMALAYCVKRWGLRDCVALIVEHGLRPESAEEAACVRTRLLDMGVAAEILPWTHGDLSGRIHEIAREARYGLLFAACRRLGAGDLLLAHHSGDQAETVLMRLAKGSGIDGLAGIPPQQEREGIRLVRPFLGLTKERLIATCDAAKIAYVTDPSNASAKYARGRLRKILPLLEAEGLSVGNLTMLATRAREAKEALGFVTAEFLKTAARAEIGGTVCLKRQSLRDIPRAIALRALTAALRLVHDDAYPPEYAPLSALLDEVVQGGKSATRTLYGCMVSVSANKVTVLREPSAAKEAVPLSPGGSVFWDGRWTIFSDSSVPAGTIRALGEIPHQTLDALAPGLRKLVPQGRVRASLPGLWDGEKLRAIPSFDEAKSLRMAFGRRGGHKA